MVQHAQDWYTAGCNAPAFPQRCTLNSQDPQIWLPPDTYLSHDTLYNHKQLLAGKPSRWPAAAQTAAASFAPSSLDTRTMATVTPLTTPSL
jgi:hypothetical protein